jgi:hypothetical protein
MVCAFAPAGGCHGSSIVGIQQRSSLWRSNDRARFSAGRHSRPTEFFRAARSKRWRRELRAVAEMPGASKTSSRLEAFVKWLAANEVFVSDKATWGRASHPLVVAEQTLIESEPAGRGFLARRDIQAGEVLFQVPFHLCFTKDVAVRRFAALNVPELADEEEFFALATLLLYERGLDESWKKSGRGPGSFWGPYLDILPPVPWEFKGAEPAESLSMDPLDALWLWAEDEMQWLQGSPTLLSARALRSKVEREYAEACERLYRRHPHIFDLEGAFRLERFLWAFGVLFSRAVSLPAENGMLALVPYADLANHSAFCVSFIDARTAAFPYAFRASSKQKRGQWWQRFLAPNSDDAGAVANTDSSHYREDAQREVVAYADRFYDKFEQVYVSYGQKSNAELLLLYGFVSDRNPYNSVEVCVSLSGSEAAGAGLLDRKRSFLLACGRDPDKPECFPLYADRYPLELMQLLRFASLTEQDAAGYSDLEQIDVAQPVNRENEIAAKSALLQACKIALQAYPTSADEDDAALKDKSMAQLLSRKQRLSVRLRRGEKRILERTIAGLEREIQDLRC